MHTNDNATAWNQENYKAWVERFGTPSDYAIKIMKNPKNVLSVLGDLIEPIQGKTVMNLMGSNGNKAVALSLLGATVTVVDFSEANAKYALDLAKAANCSIEYLVSDILELDMDVYGERFDLVFAEMGILHYFLDLDQFFQVFYKLLKSGGKAIVRDFHPISTKLIVSRGSTAKVRKHKVEGDYFDKALIEKEVAYSKYLDDAEPEKVYLRNWTLGEIISSAAASGLIIKSLYEEPNMSSESFDKGIPKSFTLVMKK